MNKSISATTISAKGIKPTKIKNKGTGAGGSNTSKNGLPYESLTALDDRITIIDEKQFSHIIKFNESSKSFIKPKDLFKCMQHTVNQKVKKAHGCKKPDECYVDEELKNIFIIEKKFQQCSGSCVEKIQTGDFKLWQYNRTFDSKYKIVYIYCLSDWFKTNCMCELEYLNLKEIPYFWGNSDTYKDDIISFMLNYK